MPVCRSCFRRGLPALAIPLLALWLQTSDAAAQKPLPAEPAWGTTATTYVQVPPASFRPRSQIVEYNTNSLGQSLLSTGGAALGEFHAGVALPSGAQIVYLELDFRDVSPLASTLGALVVCDFLGNNCGQYPSAFLDSGPAFAGGDGWVSADLSAQNLFVDNFLKHYSLVVVLTTDLDVELRGMVVGYRLRVSPPPGAASFNDVPTNHPFFQFIEALVAAGITAGCNAAPPMYCPDQPLTRGQMAVFLAKALGLHFP